MKKWWHDNARFVYQSNSPKFLLSELASDFTWNAMDHGHPPCVLFKVMKKETCIVFQLMWLLLRHVLLNWKGEYNCHIHLALLKGNRIKRSTLWLCGLCKRWRNWMIRCAFCVYEHQTVLLSWTCLVCVTNAKWQ